MTVTLGVDIGTYETKGVLVDASGAVVASASRPHELIVPRPGWAEHRALEDWWNDVVFVCRALLERSGLAPGAVAAVGCSGIGPCMLPVDRDGEPLANAILYGVDTRASREIEDLNRAIGPDLILARCGNALTSQSVGPKILWFKRHHPEVFARTATIMNSTTFVVHRLTGRAVIDHYSASGYAPLYSAEGLGWDTSLFPDLIEAERLPELLWSAEVAGAVTPRAAADTGLLAGTPVITGTIDAAAEALSVGAAAPGDAMVMYGSTVFTILVTDEPTRDPRLWYAPWLFPGLHASMAGLATSGTLTHWFRDQLARDLDRASAHERLAVEAATSPPGAKGIVVLPHFSGERTPLHDPQASGCFFGLNLTHTRADLYRGVLEGIAYGVNHILETYGEAGREPVRLLAVGGGTRNAVWLQAVSDVSGRDQLLCATATGAAYGDAFLAALAVGRGAPGDMRGWNPVARTIVPNPDTAAVYRRGFGIYKDLYRRTRPLMTALSSGD